MQEVIMKYSPKYYNDIKKRYPKIAQGFEQFALECSKAGPLDKKNQKLVKLGVAIGIGSEGDVQNLTIQALEDGVSPDELRHAVLLSATTAGFPGMIVAMQWVEDIITTQKNK
jgi:4-carboxymuconolactone decarboxylase